jgi:hypothetical protein
MAVDARAVVRIVTAIYRGSVDASTSDTPMTPHRHGTAEH